MPLTAAELSFLCGAETIASFSGEYISGKYGVSIDIDWAPRAIHSSPEEGPFRWQDTISPAAQNAVPRIMILNR